MPVYKKREIEGKDMRVTVRLSADEVSTFDKVVRQVGAGSRSELMRLLIHNYVHNGGDVPAPNGSGVQMSTMDAELLAGSIDGWCAVHKQTMDQLKGVANNINQVTKDVHTGAQESAQLYPYLQQLTILLKSYSEIYEEMSKIAKRFTKS